MVPWNPMEHPTSPWSGLGLGVGRLDIPWYPKAPWDYRTGWTRGTKHIPDLVLVGYPMGSHGTMGQWDVPGHPTAKSDNPHFLFTPFLNWVQAATAKQGCCLIFLTQSAKLFD